MFPDQSAPNLLQGLNPEQLSAVTLPPQSALVLAGAGSGKTRVLTTRIAWLLQSGQASVHSIMAVTFTNKAAKEMQTRLGAMIPINVRAMWLGTFHGLCHRFLRLHHRDAVCRLPFKSSTAATSFPSSNACSKASTSPKKSSRHVRCKALSTRKRIRFARFRLGRARSAHKPHDWVLRRIRQNLPTRRRGRFRRTHAPQLRNAAK